VLTILCGRIGHGELSRATAMLSGGMLCELAHAHAKRAVSRRGHAQRDRGAELIRCRPAASFASEASDWGEPCEPRDRALRGSAKEMVQARFLTTPGEVVRMGKSLKQQMMLMRKKKLKPVFRGSKNEIQGSFYAMLNVWIQTLQRRRKELACLICANDKVRFT